MRVSERKKDSCLSSRLLNSLTLWRVAKPQLVLALGEGAFFNLEQCRFSSQKRYMSNVEFINGKKKYINFLDSI